MNAQSFGLSFFAIVSIVLGGSPRDSTAEPEWTVMIYGGTDSSAEEHILDHLSSLRYASTGGQDGEVILLYDRAPGFSDDATLFGENFEDTRLFRLNGGKWDRVAGGSEFGEITLSSTFEANTGDAHTLKKFIRSCKAQYPAKHYALILFGHGNSRSILPDMGSTCADSGEGDDVIFTAEITEVLSEDESVDFTWFDVCSFGGIENAYQLRPGNGRFHTDAMIATPPSSSPAPMRHILVQAGILGKPKRRGPLVRSGLEFGKVAIATTRKYLLRDVGLDPGGQRECWGLYDLSRAKDVKDAVDRLARALATSDTKQHVEEIRGSEGYPSCMNYVGDRGTKSWIASAHFDLYDLAERIRDADELNESARAAASALVSAVDGLVTDSVGMGNYPGFENGKNGIFIVFPDGDAEYSGQTHWAKFGWYHPNDRRKLKSSFGNYAWCRDGATEGNHVVENWFELLDSWFDTDDAKGGVNDYRW